MKQTTLIFALCWLSVALIVTMMGLGFAQNKRPITITIPADIAAAMERVHATQHAATTEDAKRAGRTLTEDDNPATVSAMLSADIATAIADKVVRFAPQDLPRRQGNESDLALRNRYQKELRRKIAVK